MVRCTDDTLYTGVTTDMERRVSEHNDSKKGAKYTRNRRPVELVYFEQSEDRSGAQKRESELKKMKKIEKMIMVENFQK